MNTKSLIIGIFIGAAVFGGGGYWYGMKSASAARSARFAGGVGAAGANFRGGATTRGNFIGGEIIAKDDKSITVKTQDGSTHIVLMAASSQISKSATGTAADLSDGTQVIVTGTQNADGSLTAQTVQIRPAGSPAFGPGPGSQRNSQ